ncbi:hypothetical protein AXF42_Ash005323 [Apostasia shenzhenica]|uniref:Reverse transcriptase domain-containing protein n=1 Tax=Apostasia shenzhenica TaxID=1088818 RepID=A0A2I0B6J8_9ASPA|nr:hypothetical protein AXF42_Ash005323 [Apostasia shenzhenica]
MYEGAVTCVRTQGGLSKDFLITVGLHQGSALSPYLFALIMEVMTGHIQVEVYVSGTGKKKPMIF